MSDDLASGPSLGDWGAPSQVWNYCTGDWESGGWIWYGDLPCKKEDIEFMQSKYGEHVKIDWPT